ncbi:MAG: hypothetical protein ABIS17_14175 [Casimicrobiaceae bacterium]
MGWFLLESMVALLVAVAIVWWTMRPAGRRDRADQGEKGAASKTDERDGGKRG